MAKVIGLTGGIGSGKTTVAREFESLGVPVYIADTAAANIMETPEAVKKVSEKFGPGILENDKIDRKKLGEIVFQSPEKLQELNRIIHPLVAKNFDEWLRKNDDRHFVIKEAAILFESGSYLNCDKIITVIAPLEVRIQRVMSRDGATREAVLQRIGNQWTDAQKMSKSDYIIENSDLKIAKNQVNKIFAELTNL